MFSLPTESCSATFSIQSPNVINQALGQLVNKHYTATLFCYFCLVVTLQYDITYAESLGSVKIPKLSSNGDDGGIFTMNLPDFCSSSK